MNTTIETNDGKACEVIPPMFVLAAEQHCLGVFSLEEIQYLPKDKFECLGFLNCLLLDE